MNIATGRLIVVVCLFLFAACTDSTVDRLIPPSATNGGLANFTVSDIKVQKGKSINGGMLVSGSVLVPYDIKREQVKPTLLAAIKGLKDKYRDCEWIIVYAVPHQKLTGTGINAGMAEYAERKISIAYGVPSAAQLAAPPIDDENKKFLDGDYEPVKLMSKADFELAVAVDAAWQAAHRKLLYDADQKAMQNKAGYGEIYARETAKISDAKLATLTSQEMGIPAAGVKKLRKQLLIYYGPFWGHETMM